MSFPGGQGFACVAVNLLLEELSMSFVDCTGKVPWEACVWFPPDVTVFCASPSADGAVCPFIVINPGLEKDYVVNPVSLPRQSQNLVAVLVILTHL